MNDRPKEGQQSERSCLRVDTSFNMMIVGMTNCGKTYYLLKMIERDYFKHFDYIFLICPTYNLNKTYQEWEYKDDEKFFPIPCDQDSVEKFLKFIIENFGCTNSLIILDDCAASQAVKNRTSTLVKLAFSARHYGFSTVVITQQLTSIAKPYRENIAKLVSFYNPSKKDMQTITDDFLNVEKEEIKDITQKLKNNAYSRLEILLRSPYTHEVIIPNI